MKHEPSAESSRMRYYIAGAIVATLLASTAFAQAEARAPRFADYPVKHADLPVTKPALSKAAEDDDYLLRRHDSFPDDARTNFAGPYYLLVFGCGSACVNAAIYDTDGRLTEVPFSISGWRRVYDDFSGVEFRAGSRLIVFNGELNEEKNTMGRHYYLFENGALKHLLTEKVPSGNFTVKPK
jgi:hypothetical protein